MGTKGITNRQRIIEAADQLFYQRGYNQTSFSDISDATGLPRGNFYYYFKTKEDILDAVVTSRVQFYSDKLQLCDQAATDPQQRLLQFVRMPLQNQEQVLNFGCPIGSLSAELGKSPQDEAVRVHITAVFDLLLQWCVKQWRALGIANPRAQQLAMDLLARMQGMVLLASIYHDADYLQRASADIENWLNQIMLQKVTL